MTNIELYTPQKVTKIEQVLSDSIPNLRSLNLQHGANLKKLIALHVSQLFQAANSNIETSLLAEAVDIFIDEFPHYKVEDLVLIKRQIISGKHGNIYGQLNLVNLFAMVRKYDAERSDALVEKHRHEAQKYVALSDPTDEQPKEKSEAEIAFWDKVDNWDKSDSGELIVDESTAQYFARRMKEARELRNSRK